MTSMKLVKLCFAIVIVATCLPAQPSSAGNIAYLSATGGGLACTAAAPCATFLDAFASLLPSGGRILCLDPVADTGGFSLSAGNAVFDIDCPAGSWAGSGSVPVLNIIGPNLTLTFRNMAFDGIGGATSAIKVGKNGSGTLVFENCVFANSSGDGLDIEPTGALTLVVTNSRVSNNTAGGVVLKPASGGSVTATFNGVTITKNAGGLHTDTTNGPVEVDVSDSTISNNADNGIIAIGAAGGTNVVNLNHDVIASNGQAGIAVSGGNAAVFVDTTLLDSNATGATSVPSSGQVYTYKNNRLIGSVGSGFTASTTQQ
jgi:hypothetical protein